MEKKKEKTDYQNTKLMKVGGKAFVSSYVGTFNIFKIIKYSKIKRESNYIIYSIVLSKIRNL